MSRVVAARENISAGVFGFVGWECVVGVDLEWWRVEGGFWERVFEVG